MSSHLVDLIEKVAANPDELAKYKQDPIAYLEQADLTLSSDEQDVLFNSTSGAPTSTVCTVQTTPLPSSLKALGLMSGTMISRMDALQATLPFPSKLSVRSSITYEMPTG